MPLGSSALWKRLVEFLLYKQGWTFYENKQQKCCKVMDMRYQEYSVPLVLGVFLTSLLPS